MCILQLVGEWLLEVDIQRCNKNSLWLLWSQAVAPSLYKGQRLICKHWPKTGLAVVKLKCVTQTGNGDLLPSMHKLHLLKCVGFKVTFPLKVNVLHFWFVLHFYKFHYRSMIPLWVYTDNSLSSMQTKAAIIRRFLVQHCLCDWMKWNELTKHLR